MSVCLFTFECDPRAQFLLEQSVHLVYILCCSLNHYQILGTNQAQKSGTDALLDLLSIGTTPALSSFPALDGLSLGQGTDTSVSALAGLASTSTTMHATQPSPLVGKSPVVDLLNGFGPSEQIQGMILTAGA